MEQELITRASLFGLSHYLYGTAYYGSCSGMRFRLARHPLEDVSRIKAHERPEGSLQVCVWPEPYSYEHTPASEVTERLFPFTEEGLDAACAFLNESCEARFAK